MQIFKGLVKKEWLLQEKLGSRIQEVYVKYIFDFNNNTISELDKDRKLKKCEAELIKEDNGQFAFKSSEFERFNEFLNNDLTAIRKSQKGISLRDEMGISGNVLILRAVHSKTDTFKPMDYVMFYNGSIAPSVYVKMRDYLDEGEELTTPAQRRVGWVAAHAQSMAVSYDESHHVIVASVKSSDVYKATNEGEYFYDGPIIQGKVVFGVHQMGYFMSAKEMEPEYEQDMSY